MDRRSKGNQKGMSDKRAFSSTKLTIEGLINGAMISRKTYDSLKKGGGERRKIEKGREERKRGEAGKKGRKNDAMRNRKR